MPDAVALIDPLLPSEDRTEFLRWLDGRIATRPVSVLTTIRWHRRDREELAARRPGLAQLLRPLVELPVERVLVSHGEPVLRDGRAALVRAIAEAEVG